MPAFLLSPTAAPTPLTASSSAGVACRCGIGTPGSSFVRAPTAPWMLRPLLLPLTPDSPNPVSGDPENDADGDSLPSSSDGDRRAPSLARGVPGGRTHRAILGVIRRIRALDRVDPVTPTRNPERLSFNVPLAADAAARPKAAPWAAAARASEPVELRDVFRREKKAKEVTQAERLMPPETLGRLRRKARLVARGWIKAKKAGITMEVVEEVRQVWQKKGDLAAVRIVEPLRRNMNRAREIIETKTGGLVVWSRKDTLVVYNITSNQAILNHTASSTIDILVERTSQKLHSGATQDTPAADSGDVSKSKLATSEDENVEESWVSGTLYEREADRMLDTLGPRFIDWWYKKPLPVDADLLPEVVPGYKTPFRRCPPGVKPKLNDEELTYLRMLARPLPTHFALGRNTKLQGLASAILKLWEKSLIAKIAVKVGLLHTNNEQMAWELKRLTGGVVILRNKFIIILYRGKDFLPAGVAKTIFDQETLLYNQQEREEDTRADAGNSFSVNDDSSGACSVGTLREYQDIQVNYASPEICEAAISMKVEKQRLEKELKEHERKLFILTKKIERSNNALAALNSKCASQKCTDLELLTEEERAVLRKMGRKMSEHVLLGRCGVHAGVIEDIHQHWKHRELVKVITRQKQSIQITHTARLLEIESGGTLISISKIGSSHAIVLYRGKNYNPGTKLSQDNLLTKREALKKSVEVQRRGSMKHFAQLRQRAIVRLKRRLAFMNKEIARGVTQNI